MVVIVTILCAFLLGSVPFFYVYSRGMAESSLVKISTRRYRESETYQLPYFHIGLMGLFILLDVIKGILAVYLSDLLLGASDFSLVIATFFCLLGNLVSQYFFKRDRISTLFIWGLFFMLNPFVSAIIVGLSLVVYCLFRNILILEITSSIIFVFYFLFVENTISYLAYTVFVCMYILVFDYERLRMLLDDISSRKY